MNDEVQAVQVTLQGGQMGAELSAKALVMLKNMMVCIGSNLGKFVTYEKDKRLNNMKGVVDKDKLYKLTNDLEYFKIRDEHLEYFKNQCKKYHVPVAEMDKYARQDKGYTYFMFPRNSAPTIAQIQEVLKQHVIDDCRKKNVAFDEKKFFSDNGVTTASQYAQAIGADRADFIKENKDKLDKELLKSSASWNEKKEVLEEKKKEVADAINSNSIQNKINSAKYEQLTFKAEDVLSGKDQQHQNIKISQDYSVEIPTNLARKVNADGTITIALKKDMDLDLVANSDKSRKSIKPSEIKSYKNGLNKTDNKSKAKAKTENQVHQKKVQKIK